MKTYHVKLYCEVIETWEIKAKNKKEAEDFAVEKGTLIDTDEVTTHLDSVTKI